MSDYYKRYADFELIEKLAKRRTDELIVALTACLDALQFAEVILYGSTRELEPAHFYRVGLTQISKSWRKELKALDSETSEKLDELRAVASGRALEYEYLKMAVNNKT